MRIVQYETAGQGRRVGVVRDDRLLDVTAARPEWRRVIDVFTAAEQAGGSFTDLLAAELEKPHIPELSYVEFLQSVGTEEGPVLHPPLDHADPHCVLVSGTGLTHLGSMQSRNQMHTDQALQADEPVTDSKKMFQWGVEGGKPATGQRGVAPEWFYKGNGTVLRGCGQKLEIPDFARDGGEEAELVGCYVIDVRGVPRRLGFALGNEWSDHATEKLNYLYLAPSKLRQCAVGPELITDFDFQELKLRCTIQRKNETIYDSGELLSGEQHMCHSLANCEDHHFKYSQHRQSGDVHLHYFGTSKLSHSTRTWTFAEGDTIHIEAEEFGAPLINRVSVAAGDGTMPQKVEPA